MKTLQIFKPGKHTPMAGGALSFSEVDLEASAKAYNPALHEAPIVVGHPKDNGPAYGWIQGLAFAEGALEATPAQVDASFAELVKAGRFKKMSACFYQPDAPNNPVPGVYYLRHVGFLGAQPPAVKGLRDASFADGEEGLVEFGDLRSWELSSLGKLLRNLRDFVLGDKGLDVADRVMPTHLIEDLERAAARPDDPEPVAAPGFSEPATEPLQEVPKMDEKALQAKADELAAQQAALDAEKAALATQAEAVNAKAAELTQKEETAKRDEASEFAEGIAKAGKLRAQDKGAVVELLLMAGAAKALEFGEGDTKTTVAPADALKRLLDNQRPLVQFGEASGAGSGAELDATNPQAIANAAVAFQESEAKAGRTVSTTQAVQAVLSGAVHG